MSPATALIVERACRRKVRLTRHVAMLVAQAKRDRGEPISAYRCPFADNDSDRHWHWGHFPSMHGVVAIAAAIRDMHDNAPTTHPEDEASAA